MKKRYILFAIAALSLLFTSCLDVEMKIRVNRDGSGELVETIFMQSDILQMVNAMGQQGQEEKSSKDKTFGFITKKELEARAATIGGGARLVSVKEVNREGFVGYQAVYSFDDVTRINVNQSPGDVFPGSLEDQGTEAENLKFDYTTGNLTIHFPNDDFSGEDSTESPNASDPGELSGEELEFVKEIWGSFRIAMMVEVQGTITSTNATYQEGSSVVLMDLDFSRILEDEEAFLDLIRNDPETIEDFKRTAEGIDGIRVELEDPVTIRFR